MGQRVVRSAPLPKKKYRKPRPGQAGRKGRAKSRETSRRNRRMAQRGRSGPVEVREATPEDVERILKRPAPADVRHRGAQR